MCACVCVCVVVCSCVYWCAQYVCRHWSQKFITGVSTTLYPSVELPQITQHPTPQHDMVTGSTVKFTVTATGDGPLTYQWQRDCADLDSLPGVSDDTLQIDSVKKKHKRAYTCVVSNAAGSPPSKCSELTFGKFLYLLFIIQQYMQP